jgi:hypothetical protein
MAGLRCTALRSAEGRIPAVPLPAKWQKADRPGCAYHPGLVAFPGPLRARRGAVPQQGRNCRPDEVTSSGATSSGAWRLAFSRRHPLPMTQPGPRHQESRQGPCAQDGEPATEQRIDPCSVGCFWDRFSRKQRSGPCAQDREPAAEQRIDPCSVGCFWDRFSRKQRSGPCARSRTCRGAKDRSLFRWLFLGPFFPETKVRSSSLDHDPAKRVSSQGQLSHTCSFLSNLESSCDSSRAACRRHSSAPRRPQNQGGPPAVDGTKSRNSKGR